MGRTIRNTFRSDFDSDKRKALRQHEQRSEIKRVRKDARRALRLSAEEHREAVLVATGRR